MHRLGERIATEKDEAYMIKRRAEGAFYRIIEKELKADPELTSLHYATVYRYLVPGARERDEVTVKKYRSTEEGTLVQMWNSMKKRGHKFEMTKEQLDNAWKDQKKKYGLKCPYTGQTMTFKRCDPNKISPDRRRPLEGYKVDNIVFVPWKVNHEKGKCSHKLMRGILIFELKDFLSRVFSFFALWRKRET